jgi:phenylacetic acid degradation protein
MALYALEDTAPVVHPEAFVHPEAVLIGDVRIGRRCFIGACAVLRADFSPIRVGDGSNVQENCVFHVTPGKGISIEEDVVIAHGAIVHDATVKRESVVGMNAVLLQGAVVEEGGFVAAGTVVPNDFVVPARKIVAGNPARIKSDVPEMYEQLRQAGLTLYQGLPERYRKGMRRIDDSEDT